MTNGWSSLGSVTSTKTESETRTMYSFSTVISPSVTTLPGEPSNLQTQEAHSRPLTLRSHYYHDLRSQRDHHNPLVLLYRDGHVPRLCTSLRLPSHDGHNHHPKHHQHHIHTGPLVWTTSTLHSDELELTDHLLQVRHDLAEHNRPCVHQN
jgi:hypothetical protein